MPDVMIAVRSGDLRLDGRRYSLRKGRTTAHSTHPVVVAAPHLWMRMPVDLPGPDVDEAEVPAEPTPTPESDPDGPGWRAAVRAWAAEQGIKVAANGKLPQAVIDQYRAAHPET